jgi:putative ABC transport system substrate-binding protein
MRCFTVKRSNYPNYYPKQAQRAELYAKLGCLLSYGNEPTVNFKRAAQYADRILRGAKPNDLPVQAPTEFVLTINLKTARALGLDVPVQLLQHAS